MSEIVKSDIFPVACPVCGSKKQKILYEDSLGDDLPPFDYAFSPEHMRTYRIARCESCSHAFCILPRENIWKNYQSVVDSEYLNRGEAHILTAKKVIAVMKKYIAKGKLLDVGCATGDFLTAAQDYYSVEGLELSKWSSEIAQKRGFNVHTCTISELPQYERYDVITLWGVIEHFESPAQEIEKISRIIKPGGYIFLWTGDIDSWLARLLGKHWWYIQGQHIQFFSKKSLNRLFLNYGFKPVNIEKYPFTTDLNTFSKSFFRYRTLRSLAKLVLANRFVRNKVITLRLPGEMLAVYRKEDSTSS
jgi:2-polyprenyl-3-methyl-5-hydroxy-6-metoxy-1,4-benzoquinol methylase